MPARIRPYDPDLDGAWAAAILEARDRSYGARGIPLHDEVELVIDLRAGARTS